MKKKERKSNLFLLFTLFEFFFLFFHGLADCFPSCWQIPYEVSTMNEEGNEELESQSNPEIIMSHDREDEDKDMP